jgi:hypothetical protein
MGKVEKHPATTRLQQSMGSNALLPAKIIWYTGTRNQSELEVIREKNKGYLVMGD